MTDADAYDPIPNAIVLNWATVIVLAFGNLMALDFQARARDASRTKGCLLRKGGGRFLRMVFF